MLNENTRREKKRERYRRNIWNNKDWEFPQINVGHQARDPGSSEDTKQYKCPQMTPRHVIFKLQKIKSKENILKKARRKKYLTCRWTNTRITSYFFSETMQAVRQWSEIFKVYREKNTHHIRVLYPLKLSLKREEDKQKFREFVASRPSLQQMLKEVL